MFLDLQIKRIHNNNDSFTSQFVSYLRQISSADSVTLHLFRILGRAVISLSAKVGFPHWGQPRTEEDQSISPYLILRTAESMK